MPWPAAHRSGGAQFADVGGARGFQPRQPANWPIQSPTPLERPPPPANDNFPLPGNDNSPRPGGRPPGGGGRPPIPPGVGAAVRSISRQSPGFARLTRVHPLIRTVSFAWDVYQWSQMPRRINWEILENWYTCPPEGSGRTIVISYLAPVCGEVWLEDARTRSGIPAYATNINVWRYSRPGPFPNGDRWFPWQDWRRKQGTSPLVPSVYPPQTQPVIPVDPQTVPWVTPTVDPFLPLPWRPTPTPGPLPRQASRTQWTTAYEGNWSEKGYDLQPDAGGKSQAPTRPQGYSPPGKREKERKSIVRKGAAVVLRGGYAVTEGIDFIEAIHDGVAGMPAALPQQYQAGKGATPWDKAQAIYEHWDKVDLEQALLNLAVNQVIDLAVGVPSGEASNFFTRHGITHGGILNGVRGV